MTFVCDDGGTVNIREVPHLGWLVKRSGPIGGCAALYDTRTEAERFAARLVRIHSEVTA